MISPVDILYALPSPLDIPEQIVSEEDKIKVYINEYHRQLRNRGIVLTRIPHGLGTIGIWVQLSKKKTYLVTVELESLLRGLGMLMLNSEGTYTLSKQASMGIYKDLSQSNGVVDARGGS